MPDIAISMILTAILLGIIEGLTEFLPVSSTGHLILATDLLGYDPSKWALFTIAIQPGAILAILVLYWRRFTNILVGIPRREREAMRFIRNIAMAFLPAVLVGLVFGATLEAMMAHARLVAWALILGGVAILLLERRAPPVPAPLATPDSPMPAQAPDSAPNSAPNSDGVAAIGLSSAVMIGCVQCLAMIPGVSRSGATILGAMAMGIDRRTSAEFSFFLAVPTLSGATAYQLFRHRAALRVEDIGLIFVGALVSFLVALVVVKGFMTIVMRFGFAPFAYYRIVVGILALWWLGAR